jgi:hypothetical protein
MRTEMRCFSIVLLLACLLSGCSADSVEAQAKKLGAREFTTLAWTSGTQEVRGQMVASFLGKHKAGELTGKQVRTLLGPSTGYYDYDAYPAYLVGNGYLWVFITDKDNDKVRKVILLPPVQDSHR